MRLFSTLSGQQEAFTPADGRTVRMYVCGPTVYANAHLGHARSAVFYDTLRRHFRATHGWRVRHVMNFTDVAEEIAHRASLEKATIRGTAAKYARRYLDDMAALGVQRPTVVTWASRHIPRMVEDVQALLDQGLAYEQDGTVYLDTVKAHPLGLVSRIVFDEVTTGDPPRSPRRNPADFVLWRNSHDWGECWYAPWSCGRPGWHNQCTAMALRAAGPTLDVHGGGIDLAFPHHDSEAAVAQALTGKPLARFWVHHGHVTVWKQKMSKSLGNFVPARVAVRTHGAAAVRLFLLSAPYRETLDYDATALHRWAALATAHRRALAAARRAGRGTRPSATWQAWRSAFDAALDSDVDTPRALGLLEEAVRAARGARGPEAAGAARALAHAGAVLGLDAVPPRRRRG